MSGEIQKKDYIVCVNSDGCAMDTMNVKHERYFGPLAAEYFNIENKEAFQEEWLRVNLFSSTRGINRFLALILTLEFVQAQGEDVGDIQALKEWTENASSLSNGSLVEEMEDNDATSLKTAYEWSLAVNRGIEEELASIDKPFEGVKESLAKISEVANIAIVSSANSEAINSEWNRHGLMPYVDYLYGQEAGSKATQLEAVKELYPTENILMVGDSPGDVSSATEVGVYFFPVLFGREKDSWQELVETALPTFLNGEYGLLHDAKVQQFNDYLESASK